MNNTEDAHKKILDDIEANPSLYEIRQLLGDKILRIDNSDGMWLCRNDGGTRRLITLVEHGEVKFLTEADIEPSALRLIKQQCPYLAFKARYRFWVFPFTGSKAAVEWTVRPDGDRRQGNNPARIHQYQRPADRTVQAVQEMKKIKKAVS